MKRSLSVLVMATAVLVLSTGAAQAKGGFELLVGAGINMCSEDGDASCDTVESGYFGLVAPGYRFHRNFGIFLDFGYGTIEPDFEGLPEGVDTSAYGIIVMPTLRGFVEVTRGLELFAGLGVGYFMFKTEAEYEGESASTSLTNMTSIKVGVGGLYWVNPQIGVGVMADLISTANSGEFCLEYPGEGEQCDDLDDDADIADFWQIGAAAIFRF